MNIKNLTPTKNHPSIKYIQGRINFLEVSIKHRISTLYDSDTYMAILPDDISELREHEDFLELVLK